MIVVKNTLTALSAAIECVRRGVTAKQGLLDGVWDADPAWGWSHHDVQENIESGSAQRCLDVERRSQAAADRV